MEAKFDHAEAVVQILQGCNPHMEVEKGDTGKIIIKSSKIPIMRLPKNWEFDNEDKIRMGGGEGTTFTYKIVFRE